MSSAAHHRPAPCARQKHSELRGLVYRFLQSGRAQRLVMLTGSLDYPPLLHPKPIEKITAQFVGAAPRSHAIEQKIFIDHLQYLHDTIHVIRVARISARCADCFVR
jgi:hypothetical protein